MKKINLFIVALFTSLSALAQTQYDYYDDGYVGGGANFVFNCIIWMAIFVVALLVLAFIISGILKFYYWINPEANPDNKRKKNIRRY